MGTEEKKEYEPLEKLDEILAVVEAFHPQMITPDSMKKTTDDEAQDAKEEWVVIRCVNDAGQELDIEVADEITLFFGDWHTHFYDETGTYEEFFDILKGIVHNEKIVVCTYQNDKWSGSFLWHGTEPDMEEIREEIGRGKKCVCSFWDSSKDVTFET